MTVWSQRRLRNSKYILTLRLTNCKMKAEELVKGFKMLASINIILDGEPLKK